jgi:hypothetical protein
MSEEEGKREALSAAPTTVVMTDFMIESRVLEDFQKNQSVVQLMALITMSK